MNGYQPPLVPQSAVTFGNERLVDPWAETMLRNTCSNFQVQNMALQQENAALKTKNQSGRLAQLVEHLLDVQEVTGSSPVPSTKRKAVYLKR